MKGLDLGHVALWCGAVALLGGCGLRVLPGTGASDKALPPSLYVQSIGGSNRSDGSFVHPLQTINQCATKAKPGQTCFVRTGIYRETVTPNNGITIRPQGNAKVTLLATDRVIGWKRSSGKIYVASVTLNRSLPANQVFVVPAMTMLNEAQWPTPSVDPLHPNWELEAQGSTKNFGCRSAYAAGGY